MHLRNGGSTNSDPSAVLNIRFSTKAASMATVGNNEFAGWTSVRNRRLSLWPEAIYGQERGTDSTIGTGGKYQ